ncbi:MAG: adenylate/guanylate cyclase domain-containing protein, partial [Proteobacteria bacterium]|nr:adenylate/guanylate cyclase domain-containing protein [Pseudomonadota bacterium]
MEDDYEFEQTRTAELTTNLCVLFADISDSTKLYEDHGDELARKDVATCVEIMTRVMGNFGGRLLKTIGDEIMCVFPEASRLVLAANEMQTGVKKASEEGKFVTGALHIKIGGHYGPGEEQATDVQGEASTRAQAVIKMAKADQILVSRRLFDELPPELQVGSRFFDKLEGDSPGEEEDIFEIIWEVSGLTMAADTQPKAPRVSHTLLVLEYQGQRVELGQDRPSAVLGRVDGNDL